MSNASEPTPQLVHTDIPALIRFAADVTTTQELADGTYCFDRDHGNPTRLRGRSPRYTLMVALGFERAARAGYTVPRPATALVDAVLAKPDDLTPGDRGLALWVLSRLGDARAEQLLATVGALDTGSFGELEGMEVAWLVLGAAAAVEAGLGADAALAKHLAYLRGRRAQKTPLFHHLGTGRGRALLPNFATQIYSVLALADVARATNDDMALDQSRRLADLLVELRRADAGWPWLYHAERGTVVEAYQVYSVHQDAMAPMAYFSLAEATGDLAYAKAGAEGLPWCFGRNELQFHFYDVSNRFAHRAIKKRGWADRAELWTNTALALSPIGRRLTFGGVEINATCRPYHQGWILEAWAGREQHVGLLGGS